MKKQKLKKLPKAKVRRNNLLIIGLGNPGSKYRETRHNAGFAVIDNLASKSGLYLGKPFFKKYLIGRLKTDSGIIYLVKPLTFMNRSGMILNEIFRKTGASASEMILVCDNMDLKPGMIRLKTRGSSAGHNGIKSVIDNIGSEDFKRLYIGVGRPRRRRKHYSITYLVNSMPKTGKHLMKQSEKLLIHYCLLQKNLSNR